LAATQYDWWDIDADVEMGVPFEQRNYVTSDRCQNGPDQRFESVGSPLNCFDDRASGRRRSIGFNDSRERLKASDGAGIQINNRLVKSGELLCDFIRPRSSHKNSLLIANLPTQVRANMRPFFAFSGA
jgi:hypothetical protein